MRKYTFYLISFIFCNYLQAAPSITDATWSGDLDNGTSITLTGTGFTTKATPGPLVYEEGDDGSFDSYWASTGGSMSLSNSGGQRHVNESYVMTANFQSDANQSARLEGQGTHYDQWACSYFIEFDADFDFGTTDFGGNDRWLSNIKTFRLWNTGAETDNVFAEIAMYSDVWKFDSENITPSQSDTLASFTAPNWPWSDEFVQFEIIYQEGDVGVANGTVKIWVDGASVMSDTSYETRDGTNVDKRIHTIGAEGVWEKEASENHNAPNTVYMSDVYCDNVWNAVFVSTSSTFAAGGVREYSKATSWSGTSITFTFHEGRHTAGTDNLYAYVRDSNGDTNANGYELTGGGTPSSRTGPMPVGDFTIEGGVVFK